MDINDAIDKLEDMIHENYHLIAADEVLAYIDHIIERKCYNVDSRRS
jgi:hypothetical protein